MIHRTIGVRELKNTATQVVREQGAEYVVTVRGVPAAVLRPFSEEDERRQRLDDIAAALDELDALAREVDTASISPKSGLEILGEVRDESWR